MPRTYFRFGNLILQPTFYVADEGLPQVIPQAKFPRYDGARSLRGTMGPRRLRLRGGLTAGPIGTVNIQSVMDTLKNALIANAPAVCYTGRSDRYLRNVQMEDLRLIHEPTWYDRNIGVEIDLFAADPYYYSTTPGSDTWTVTGSSQFRTVTPDGLGPVLPTFSVTVGGAGAVTIAFNIRNYNSNVLFTLAGSVNGGDVIVVDCLAQTVTIAGVDRMDLFDGQWPSIIPTAIQLQEAYTGTAITQIITTWIPRYY